MQISDDLFLGPVYARMGLNLNDPAPMELGVGPMGRIYIWDVVPLALNLTGLAAAQAHTGATNMTLTAGTGVTQGLDGQGNIIYVMDVPRCVDIVSANAGDTTQTALISGYDVYGQPMSQLLTFNGTTRVASTKAFKAVKTILVSATSAGNISAGTTDTLGCPVRLLSRDYLDFNYNATAGVLSAVTAAVTTSPATTTTGDVRGTLVLASASDGVKRLVAQIAIPAIGCGPNATRVGALGVDQA